MFTRDGSAGLALYPYIAAPMRRLRLGQTVNPPAPTGSDLASVQTWVRAVYQQLLCRAPSAYELQADTAAMMSGAWTAARFIQETKINTPEYQARNAPGGACAAPAASPTGGDNAQVVQVTLPSGPVIQGTQFQVGVTVKNVGGVVWGNGYTVQFVAPTGAPTANPVSFANLPPLSPGQQATVTLTVWAPTAPGTYAYQFAVLNPAQQAVAPVGNVAVSVVTPAAAAPTGVVQTTTDAVSRQEFDSFVSASLQNVQNAQHAIDAIQQANIRGYQPTYTSIPGAPAAGQPIIVQAAAAPPGGPNWLLWGIGLTALGVGAWWYFGKRKKTGRQRIATTKTITTRTTGRRRR